MKKIILLAAALLLASCSAVPKDVTQAKHGTTTEAYFTTEVVHLEAREEYFQFEGYALGRAHNGTFENWNASILTNGKKILGGKVTIDATTVKTEIPKLTGHLKSEDFFHVEKYPKITFEAESLDGGEMTGDLTFHGQTEEITFPVKIEGNTISADFLLNTKPFGMRYVGVDEKVRIKFAVSLV